MTSFHTTARQMTEMFHWPKCLSDKDRNVSAKKTGCGAIDPTKLFICFASKCINKQVVAWRDLLWTCAWHKVLILMSKIKIMLVPAFNVWKPGLRKTGMKKKQPVWFFCFFKPVFWLFQGNKILFLFNENGKIPFLSCFYSIMHYYCFRNYKIITCCTHCGIQNWG